MNKVFVLGSLNMDVAISAKRLPQKGETLKGYGFMLTPGGKGANQAVACAKAGASVSFAGCVGSDVFAEQMLQSLQENNVDCKNVRQVKATSSGSAIIIITDNDNRIIISEGANGNIKNSDVDMLLSVARPGDIFLTQLETPISVVGYALMSAKQKGLTTLLNPAPADMGCLEVLKYADILIPNESELAILGTSNDPDIAIRTLVTLGARDIIVTLGEKGSMLINKQGKKQIKSYKVQAIDTTAAGDTYCGYLAMGLAKGGDIASVMDFASAAAALTVTQKGAACSIPSFNKVQSFLENYIQS